MAESPLTNADGPVGVTIRTEGSAIPDATMVVSVRVRREVNRIPEAQVVIEAGSIPEQSFPEVDAATYGLGKAITIAAHYGSGEDQQIFSGVIVSQRLRIAESRGPRLELLCRDKAIALTRGRKSALYAASKDSDIFSRIVSDAGLTVEVTATTDSARDQLRHDATGWDFMRLLADRNGHLITVDAGKVTSAPPDMSAAAVLTLTLGEDIVAFDAEANTEGLYKTAGGLGWDDAAQDAVEGKGGALPTMTWGDRSSTELAGVPSDRAHIFTSPVKLEPSDIKTFADSRLARSVLCSIQGSVTFPGSGVAEPGKMIELKGIGAHFGGNAFVSGVVHEIVAGSWTTRAQLGQPANWLSDGDGFAGGFAAGLTAPIHGLHIGKVVQIHEDPDGRQRIKLKLPLIGAEPAQIWARFAQPYASGSAGIQFMPEVNDEVVVAFMNSDPNAPVVIGALHNGQAAQPITPEAENKLKTIQTREALKIEFDDDRKIITVSTPGGHSMVMDDDAQSITLKDSNGNSIEMSSGGIVIDSPKDIAIKATGKIDVTATGDATLSGMNVTANAQTQLTTKGGASAELSAGGQTTVKGAMVMIN
ncbi:phage baseplate assembly protein V [Rhodovulum steppense]|uniref:Gp5/Type VI secretion system Vgr protein OB-fold domain-containing protein n=1 Tax=Rhodovulum steppense TaxID=540251 RepID=A0A4R1YY35_9RHOB|nr:phage baseplate assembly protein V [Rhodovulum steppense]TCM86125.1 hypothetical protein EV216_10590 [Rhodovulum steppense]